MQSVWQIVFYDDSTVSRFLKISDCKHHIDAEVTALNYLKDKHVHLTLGQTPWMVRWPTIAGRGAISSDSKSYYYLVTEDVTQGRYAQEYLSNDKQLIEAFQYTLYSQHHLVYADGNRGNFKIGVDEKNRKVLYTVDFEHTFKVPPRGQRRKSKDEFLALVRACDNAELEHLQIRFQ